MAPALKSWKLCCVVPPFGRACPPYNVDISLTLEALSLAVQANLDMFAQILNGQAVQYKRNVRKLL